MLYSALNLLEKIWENLRITRLGKDFFFRVNCKSTDNKSKNRQMGLHQDKKGFQIKGNN
jgi:hypothetical protein